ncbi:MAG: AAA family ATPase [Halanaeroarchaeum sp.]
MQVIGVVGLPGSGKSEAATVAREMDVPVVTMGDVVRAETEDRGLDPATDHGAVAEAMREEEGVEAIAKRSLPIIEDRLADNDVVLVDGIRSDHEVAVFEDAFGEDFTLVEIAAPFDVRKARIETRGRDAGAEAGGESVADRDERERGFGMDDAMAAADVTIDNTGTLAAFHDRVRELLREASDP